jgi:hypothetical protein
MTLLFNLNARLLQLNVFVLPGVLRGTTAMPRSAIKLLVGYFLKWNWKVT